MYAGYKSCYSRNSICHPAYVAACVPVVWVPCAPSACDDAVTARDITVASDNPTHEALVGGTEQAWLTLEYLVDEDAGSPAVNVTKDAGGISTSWNDAAPTPGYHLVEAIFSAEPGSKVSIKVSQAMARLRWCERTRC